MYRHLPFGPLAIPSLESGMALTNNMFGEHQQLKSLVYNFFFFRMSTVFGNVRRRSPNKEGPLRRPQRSSNPRFQLPAGGENSSTELPCGELPSMGSRRVDAGKSIALPPKSNVRLIFLTNRIASGCLFFLIYIYLTLFFLFNVTSS